MLVFEIIHITESCPWRHWRLSHWQHPKPLMLSLSRWPFCFSGWLLKQGPWVMIPRLSVQLVPYHFGRSLTLPVIIGIDHDTVCAGVGGTAIRHSTSCAGRRAAACGRHNECCAWWQYHPRQRGPYKWSISILPRSQFYKKQGKLAFSTSCTAVRPHRRLRNDAWRRDS